MTTSHWEELQNKWLQSVKQPTTRALQELQKQGISAFCDLAIPTTKHEDWKYFNLTPLLKGNYQKPYLTQVKESHQSVSLLESSASLKLVFLNGCFCRELSDLQPQTKGIRLSLLSQLSDDEQAKWIQKFAQSQDEKKDFIPVFNAIIAQEYICIEIEDGAKITNPIEVIHIQDSNDPIVSAHQYAVSVGQGAEGMLVEYFYSPHTSVNNRFLSRLFKFEVGRNAHFSHYLVQDLCPSDFFMGKTIASVMGESEFANHTVSLGGDRVRNELSYSLEESHSEVHMNGISCLDGKSLVDHHTQVAHIAPHINSNENYKGLFNDSSRGVFNGKILVDSQAQKTNAFQSNKNLLLSEKAGVFSKPQLEIWADDVKCSHGATTGNIDRDALFYFRSRGISEKAAKAVLLLSFLNENIEALQLPKLKDLIAEKVRGQALLQ